MTAQHTQGRLVVQVCSHPSLERVGPAVLKVEGMRTAVAGLSTEPDARRLAACWNSFIGVSTEDIEAMGGCTLFNSKPVGYLSGASALLVEVLEENDAWIKEAISLRVKIDPDRTTLTERIRAFLKGGA